MAVTDKYPRVTYTMFYDGVRSPLSWVPVNDREWQCVEDTDWRIRYMSSMSRAAEWLLYCSDQLVGGFDTFEDARQELAL